MIRLIAHALFGPIARTPAITKEAPRVIAIQPFPPRSVLPDVALKFLAALNRGLTEALRIADRRLMQLNDEGVGKADWQRSTIVAP